MNEVLNRRSYDSPRTEIRRLAAVVLGIALGCFCWHILQPRLIYLAACSSLGCPDRENLILLALQQHTPGFPSAREAYREGMPYILSCSAPRPGWVQWQRVREQVRINRDTYLDKGTTGFADDKLLARGTFALPCSPEGPPGDMDGDGLWEVAIQYSAIPAEQFKTRYVDSWAVLRLGPTGNEIAWIGLCDVSARSTRSDSLYLTWRDEDGDGVKELLFAWWSWGRSPNTAGAKPPEIVAVFSWDRPGGVLRPRTLPADGSFLSWTPPNGQPVKVAQDADLDPILRRLFPVPDDFGYGRPSATQPTSASQAANSRPSGYDSRP